MATRTTRTATPMAEINLTPMIDVLLVLLIIFMVVVPVAQRALDVAVPETRTPDGTPPPSAIPVIEVRADSFRLGPQVFATETDLERALAGQLSTRRDRSVVVRADGPVDYGRMMAALDTARGAGATRIGIAPAAP